MKKQFLHSKNCRTSLSFVWMFMLLFGCLMGPVTAVHAEAEDFSTCDIFTPLGTSFNLDLDGAGNATIDSDKFIPFVTSSCTVNASSIELWMDAAATTPFSPTNVDCSDVGTTFNVYVSVNSSQNPVPPVPQCQSTAILFTVTVNDGMLPSITCPADLTGASAVTGCLVTDVPAPLDLAGFIAAGGTATDNCGVTLTSVTTATGGAGCPGDPFTFSRVYTATDPSGNTAECTQLIEVLDDERPTVVCAAGPIARDLDANCEATFTAAEFDGGSSDNCTAAADLVFQIRRTGTGPGNWASSLTFTSADLMACPSTFDIDLRVTDLCGNRRRMNACTSVSIDDNTAPVVTCPANEVILTSNDGTGDCAAEATIEVPTPTDNCGIDATTYMIDILDYNGASILGYPTLAVAGATITETLAKDPLNCDNDTYTVNYTVEDNCGNPANCSYTIRIQDDEAPVISGCPANINDMTVPADCYAQVTFTPPTAVDNCPAAGTPITPTLLITYPDGSTATTIDIVAGQAVGLFPKGTSTVEYTFTDCQDPMPNTAVCSFDVIVADNENPTAMCVGDFTTTLGPLNPGETTDFTFADFDAGSFDNCMIVTKEISDDGVTFGETLSYGCADAGTTKTITLRVTDMSGNQGTCTLEVTFLGGNLSLTQGVIYNVSCNGGSDGAIYITTNGGSGPYNYDWLNEAGGLSYFPADNGQEAVGIPAGSYGVIVTDANGCTAELRNIDVTEPTPVTVSIDDVINADCAGNETGSATATGAGGTGTITYAWSDGQTTATATGLHAGGYSVTATDANGCTAQASTSISDPNVIVMEVLENNMPSCNGATDGSVVLGILQVSTGTPPITLIAIVEDGSTTGVNIPFPGGNQPLTIPDLGAGHYVFVAQDDNGCFVTQSVTVDEPTLLIAEIIATTDALCNGSSDGTATVNATGGTTGYTYLWSDGQTTATATGLAAGTYTVVVTDANGCEAEAEATIGEPDELQLNVNAVVNVSCHDGSDGAIYLSTVGGTGPYNYNWIGPIFGLDQAADNVQDAINITAGFYIATVTDANGCTATIARLVTQPSPVTVSIGNVTNADCAGGETGSATAYGAGGTGTITYTWSNGQTGANATDLHAGGYTVIATDENGCTAQASTFISDPNGLSLEVIESTKPWCNGDENGSVTLGILNTGNLGGTPPYRLSSIYHNGNHYNVNIPFSGNTLYIDDLGAGQYSFVVKDDNNCEVAESFMMHEPTVLIADIITSTDVSCYGDSDGTATVYATGGTTPYTYEWSDGQTTVTATGLAAGTYTVTVTDANDCETEIDVTIEEPTALSASVTSTSDVSCNGGSDGSIHISVNGGTAPYSYDWTGNVPADDVQDALNIPAGTYGVVITDANGCQTSLTGIVITEPSALTVSIGNITNANCAGNEDGSAIATGAGGTGAITYAWSNGQTGANATDLHAGGYSVTATDANGCTAQASTFISDPTTMSMEVLESTEPTCNGEDDGSVTLAILQTGNLGGTPPYTLATIYKDGSIISSPGTPFPGVNGDNPLLVSNLGAGQYSFIVVDANGCEVVEEHTMDEPTLLIAETIHTTDALCNGSLDGTATVNATGGTTPYTYAWSSGAISATATGLAAGSYTVTVTDANGCEATSTATIGEPAPLLASVTTTTNVSCNGGFDGNIEIAVNGGTAPYSYAWTGNIPADDVQDALNIPAGTYGVLITDSNGCTFEITNINISEPSPVTVTIGNVVNADCAGNETGSAVATASGGTGSIYNYAWSNGQNGTNQATATGLHAGGYSVTVTDENGCTAEASTFISDPNGLEMTVFNLTDVTCNGGADGTVSVVINGGTPPYTFNAPLVATGPNNATASGLAAGSYVFTAIDANGCPVSVSAQIDEPTLLIAEIIATTDALCNGSADGTATVNATGGTTGYTYLWSDGQTTAIATGLAAGTYTVVVTDANDCTAETSATIGEPDALSISVGGTFDVSCNGGFDGSIYINNPVGGTGPFNYEWTSTTGFTFDQATDNAQDQINNLPAGSYNVTVTDANGCTFAINDIVINEPTLLTVSISDVINANCIGNEDGSATATAAGGTAPYTYAWSNGDNTATASALHAGGYTVIATDANGCTAIASVSITDPNGLLFGITESTNVSCNGGNDGTATFGINGGTPPYALIGYIGPNGQQVDLSASPLPVVTGTIFTDMSAGLYAFFVEDANGCITANNVIILEPTELFAEIIHQEDVTCPGGSDGEATVNATGGTTPYTYEWSASAGGQTTNIATGLVEGLHSVTVTDANGCTDVINVVILQNDDVAPEFVTTIPGDVTVECDAIPTPFVVIPAWHTTDNCSAAIDITVDYTETIIDIVCANTYTIKRKWTITDEAGNTAFHIQKVYVQDTTAPTFTVPADVTIECDEDTSPANTGDVTDQMDNCSAPADIVVAFTDVEDLSGCGGYTGTITRTWTATDECGNVTTKVQVITIEDTTAPTALCNSFSIELDALGQASITIAQVDAGSTDNCASLSQLTYSLDKTDFTCADLGANIVTLTVTDPCGNVGTCEATITVEDNIDPIITCPGDMVIHLDPGACDQVISYDVLATDNCDVTVTQIGGSFSSGDAFPIGGPYILTYQATDEAGNTAQCSFSVTVHEYVPSSNDLTCNSLVHVTLDENCEALVTPDMILEGNNYGCYDDYVITVTDANGNIVPGNILTLDHVGTIVQVSILDPVTGVSCWGEILVEDKIIPTFDCPADIDVTCNGATDPAITGEPTLTSCEASITIEFEDDYTDFGCAGDPSDSSVRARIIRTWTVTDDSGNSDQCVQTINILKPELADVVFPNDLDEFNGDALDCGAVAANPALTGPDYTGYPQYVNQDVTPGGLCAFSIGYVDSELEICAGGSSYEIIRTWTVRNMCEPLVPGVNPVYHIQSIKVLDTTAPALVCPTPTTLSTTGNSCDVAVTLPAANVSDDCSGYDVYVETPNGTIHSNGGFIGTYGIGEHTVTYYATDACGNISSCDYTFEVADEISPISICDEHTTVAIGSDGTASIDAITFDDGSFDACSDVTFDVRRMDNPACPGADFTSFGPSVPFFCCDVNTIVMVELRVTDASGNTNSCMVEVEVEDKINPTVICPSDKDVECSETYLDYIVVGQPLPQDAIDANGSALASDNCPGVTLTNNVISNTVDCGNGTVTIVWTATDAGGRTSSCIQRYFVANNDPFYINAANDNDPTDDVVWPADYTVNTCGTGLEPSDLPSPYDQPQIFEGACDNIAVGHHDQVLDFGVDDACLKILRKWYVIDWCQAGANQDPTQPGPGVWHYTQIIKVINSNDPNVTVVDFPAVVDNYEENCGSTFAAFEITADDDCTAQSDLQVTWEFSTGLSGTGFSASGAFANGSYSLTFTVSDGCDNTVWETHDFTVVDAKKPTPVCIFGIATTVMPSSGAVTIWASDFESGSSYDNCTAYDDLEFSFSQNINNDNITIACDDIPADGLYPITLYVTDAAGNFDFCSTFINVQDPNGVCGIPTATINGNVENENQEVIQDVTVTLSDDNGPMPNVNPVVTGSNGAYSFNMAYGNYDVTPEKDINYLNGVTTYDLVLISKHILGLELLDSPYKMIAADANNSQNVSTLDIVKLRALILYLDDELANNTSWRFVDANHVFSDPINPWLTTIPEYVALDGTTFDPVNFTAIKVGDVNGSATPNNLLGSDTRTYDGNLALSLEATKVAADEEFTVDFKAKDFNNIAGYQFTLGFDNNAVEFVDVTANLEGLNEANFGLTKLNEGVITTSWNSNKGVSVENGEVLFSITFRANAAVNTKELLSINSRYTESEAYDGSDLYNVVLEFNGNQVSNGFELYQNTPNPFKAETTIGFNMPEAGAVTLTIYDVSGRTLRLIEMDAVKGANSVNVSREGIDATGVLYYQLETATETATKKMILVD